MRLDFQMKKSIKIKHLVFILVVLMPLFGCLSERKLTSTPILPSNENTSYEGTRVLNGYLYRFKEKRCPGTKSSEYNSPCYREGLVYSKTKITNLAQIVKRHSVILDQKRIFVLDEFKYPYLLPENIFDDRISIGEMFESYDQLNESVDYVSDLFHSFSDNQCNTELIKGIEIKECELINEITGLSFTINKDLFKYGTSPRVGLTNFGMPFRYSGDTLSILWLVPNSSPLLHKL